MAGKNRLSMTMLNGAGDEVGAGGSDLYGMGWNYFWVC